MTSLKLAAIMILAGACSRENTEGKPPPEVQPEAALTGLRQQHMRNCPSAVPSATTTVTPTADGVSLTIISKDPDARRQILWRTIFQSMLGDPIPFLPAHSGLHGGPGTIGYCPIIHAGTTVTYNEIPEGVVVHVATNRPGEVQMLQRATENRARALALATPAS